ncbi:MAG: hypothetical protein GF346_11185 [Candidatus Eisenbacteria bacterium]|nr:hypothetical protein [Candidatus Latescibacterota bacterium]MBD3302999.1 hypothetical protein [Candidatus Eisenbacteria bacterium]
MKIRPSAAWSPAVSCSGSPSKSIPLPARRCGSSSLAYASPSSGRTTIRFGTGGAESVRLSVHDPSGRWIRRLADGVLLPAGTQERPWDGRGRQGREVAGGIYSLRLDLGGEVRTAPVVRSRWSIRRSSRVPPEGTDDAILRLSAPGRLPERKRESFPHRLLL